MCSNKCSSRMQQSQQLLVTREATLAGSITRQAGSLSLPSLRCVWMTSSARPGTVRPVLALVPHRGGVAAGQPGSTDSVLCFVRVPAWSVVWVLAGDIGECRGWLLCPSSA